MSKKKNTTSDKYYARFASKLRALMKNHPDTGESTTQKALADFLGVRPQTVSLYCTGESLPNCEQLLKISEYFKVTTDFLMTGKRPENAPVRDILGLSERTIENLKLVKEGYFEDTPSMLAILDYLLGNKDFYLTLEKTANILSNKKTCCSKEYEQILIWNASNILQSFFLEMFQRNLLAIYEQLKK